MTKSIEVYCFMIDNIKNAIHICCLIIGTSWMNWSLSGSLLLGFVLLFLFPARYRRTDIDNVVVHVNAEDKYDDSVNRNTITGHPARYDE